MMKGAWMRGVIQLFTENPKIAGKGCGSWFILNTGNVKCAFFALVSDILVIDGVDGLHLWILIHEVDPWPVGPSLCVSAGLVLLESFPAFLLSVPLDLAEVAEFAISIGVFSAIQVSSSF